MVYTANLVYTVNLIYTVNIVYTVDMIYTVDSSCTYILLRLLWVLIKCFRQLGETSLRLWRGQTLRWPGSPKNPEWILESGRCAKLTSRLSQYSSKIALLWQNGLIFFYFSQLFWRDFARSILKMFRFGPGSSRTQAWVIQSLGDNGATNHHQLHHQCHQL